jgi:hypothetical protein
MAVLAGLPESVLVDESGVSLIDIIPPWFSIWEMNNRPVDGRSSET